MSRKKKRRVPTGRSLAAAVTLVVKKKNKKQTRVPYRQLLAAAVTLVLVRTPHGAPPAGPKTLYAPAAFAATARYPFADGT